MTKHDTLPYITAGRPPQLRAAVGIRGAWRVPRRPSIYVLLRLLVSESDNFKNAMDNTRTDWGTTPTSLIARSYLDPRAPPRPSGPTRAQILGNHTRTSYGFA